MQFANALINHIARFIRLDFHEELNADMLVMEPIYAVDFRTYEVEKRELWYEVVENEMSQLRMRCIGGGTPDNGSQPRGLLSST